jgi:carboxymethylenebutenolidase
MGGRLAFLTAEVFADRLRAAISFYGGGIGESRGPERPALLDRVDAIRAPLLLAYGANDKSIGPDEHARVAQALSAAGKRYTLDVYAGAGHAFMRDVGATYHEPSAREAWAAALSFFARHLGTERSA